MKIILTTIYLIFTSLGIFLMKLGGDSFHIALKDKISFSMGFITFFGLACYLISFILWQRILVNNDLSYIVPITTGIVQIVVLLIGCLYFKESISFQSIIGIVLVILGIVLMTLGKKQ